MLLYKGCSKRDQTFTLKTLLLTLQHSKHCPLQSSPTLLAIHSSQRFFHCWNASWNAPLSEYVQISCGIFLNHPCGLETTSFQSGFRFLYSTEPSPNWWIRATILILISPLLCDVTHPRSAVSYRRFGKTCRSRFQRSSSPRKHRRTQTSFTTIW